MIVVITIIHIIVSTALILVVLLQTGKGADIGAVFGGSSSTIFGSSGAGNFLTRLTTGLAVVFMLTSITLGYFSGKKPAASIFDRRAPAMDQPVRKQGPPLQTQPAAPTPPTPQPQKPGTP
jgi:preprotein translocase subunit SecG